jgi:hypothetical protein
LLFSTSLANQVLPLYNEAAVFKHLLSCTLQPPCLFRDLLPLIPRSSNIQRCKLLF